jgi:hypothetical protein
MNVTTVRSIPPAEKLEPFKAMIQITLETLRLLFFLNGGAAVALLTYVGNIKTNAACTLSTQALGFAMACFVVGLFTCTLAFGASYATQSALFRQNPARPTMAHAKWVWTTVALGILSLSSFSIGALHAATHLLITNS